MIIILIVFEGESITVDSFVAQSRYRCAVFIIYSDSGINYYSVKIIMIILITI